MYRAMFFQKQREDNTGDLSIPVYHITHKDNLPQILFHNGLWFHNKCHREGLNSVSIAHEELKQSRQKTRVPVGSNTTYIGDYVPFYFSNRSPMLYAIHTDFVKKYRGGQEDVIYLVSSVQKVVQHQELQWCFSDGHPIEKNTKFYDSIDFLEKIDWPLINNWVWKNTSDDNDRKRRKQAEFLVHESFPLNLITRIAVYSDLQKMQVESILRESSHHNKCITIEEKWYYDKKENNKDCDI